MAGLLGRLFRRRREEELRCSAVVPAAGSSTRMGQDKLLLPLGEQPGAGCGELHPHGEG